MLPGAADAGIQAERDRSQGAGGARDARPRLMSTLRFEERLSLNFAALGNERWSALAPSRAGGGLQGGLRGGRAMALPAL